MPLHDMSRDWYAYTADDGTQYQLATTVQNGAVANGATAIAVNSKPTFRRGWVARHVYGEDATGDRTKVPVLDPASGLWTGTTTSFTKDGVSYTVQGKVGEKRVNRGG